MHTIKQTVPRCDQPMSTQNTKKYNIHNANDAMDCIGADCWAIGCVYNEIKENDLPIIEYNEYVWDGPRNPEHPNYIKSIERVKGDKFRDFAMSDPDFLLNSCKTIDIYMFGINPWRIRICRTVNQSDEITLWESSV